VAPRGPFDFGRPRDGAPSVPAARPAGAEQRFEQALAEGRVGAAAALAMELARRGQRGIGPSTARLQRVLAADGLESGTRIEVLRGLAVLHSRGGRYGDAFESMADSLILAQETGRTDLVCEAELHGAFLAVQVGALEHAHTLLDNAEWRAAELADDTRLGLIRIVRGVACLAEGDAERAVELIADGIGRSEDAGAREQAFALRQLARALVRAERRESAPAPLAAALASALERRDDLQVAECLETFATLQPGEAAARGLGAACAFRARAAARRWADEGTEADGAIAAVRGLVGFDRTTDLAAEGHDDPDAAARRALALLA
jgi:hypothetical protein